LLNNTVKKKYTGTVYSPSVQEHTVQYRPSPAMLEAFPDMGEDFIQRPLDELARRRFLHDCPRNLARDLEPPLLNRIPGQSAALQQSDRQLRDIQYRAAALARPLDWFAYQALQTTRNNGQWRTHSIAMVRQTLALLGDFVSHVSALRRRALFPDGFDNASDASTRYLVPPDEFVAHLRQVRAIQELAQPPRSSSSPGKKRKGKGRAKAPQQTAAHAPNSSASASSNDSYKDSSVGFSDRSKHKSFQSSRRRD